MSSPRGQEDSTPSWERRSFLRAVAFAGLLGPVLAACEGASAFRPMYGASNMADTEAKLASVSFGTIPGRVGQRIRNELVFQSTGGGHGLPPKYHLDVAIREQVVSTLVRKDGESQSQVYNLEAKFQLIRIADKAVLLEGMSYGRAGFERYDSIYSNVKAREDAENRAARTVAQDIKTRLAAYLAGTA